MREQALTNLPANAAKLPRSERGHPAGRTLAASVCIARSNREATSLPDSDLHVCHPRPVDGYDSQRCSWPPVPTGRPADGQTLRRSSSCIPRLRLRQTPFCAIPRPYPEEDRAEKMVSPRSRRRAGPYLNALRAISSLALERRAAGSSRMRSISSGFRRKASTRTSWVWTDS